MRLVSLIALSWLATAVTPAVRAAEPAAPAKTPDEFALPETARIENFAWFSGCWSMALPDGIVEEHWLPPAGGAMLGLSRTVKGGVMKEFEFLSLRAIDGKLAYVSIPSRQRETAFALVRYKSNAAVFENPTHDYPQRIIYRKTDTGITAVIEGVVKGKLRSAEFVYTACR